MSRAVRADPIPGEAYPRIGRELPKKRRKILPIQFLSKGTPVSQPFLNLFYNNSR